MDNVYIKVALLTLVLIFLLVSCASNNFQNARARTQILSNPCFESGALTPWYVSSGATANISTSFHTGKHSLLLSGRTSAASSVTQDITSVLLANGQGNYNLSSWVKLASGSDLASAFIRVRDDFGERTYGDFTTTADTSWNQVKTTQNIMWHGTLHEASFIIMTNSSLADMYIDDCCLQKQVFGGSMKLSVDLSKQGKVIENKFSTFLCWHLGDFWATSAASKSNFQPSQYFSALYPNVKIVQIMTATGGNTGRDLFIDPDDRNTLTDYKFDTLVTAVQNITDQGLTPYIVTGNIPLKFCSKPHVSQPSEGGFDVNVRPPDDDKYGAYYDYIKALAKEMVDKFGIKQVKTWKWGVFTECDNAAWFMTEDGKPTVKLPNTMQPGKDSLTFKDDSSYIKKLENDYNCKIKFVQCGDDGNILSRYISSTLAADPMVDVYYENSVWSVPSLFVKNIDMPLDDVIDLKLKQWNSKVTDIGYYKGKHYVFASGNFTPNGGIFFNQRIFQKDGLPDLYELQKNKQWTWDKMLEIAVKATRDTNGDGKIEQWGFGDGAWFVSAQLDILMYSNGGRFTKMENGKEIFAMDEPAAIEALQFAYDLFNKYKVINPSTLSSSDWTYGAKQFSAGNTAMISNGWIFAPSLKMAMKGDKFGWVFFPMGPRMTDYVDVITNMPTYQFPVSAKHPKEVGRLVTEFFAPKSWTMPSRYGFETDAMDEQTVKTCLDQEAYMDRQKKFKACTALSVPYIRDNLWSGFPKFIGGSQSAQAWVESIKPAAQQSIDELWDVYKH